uniref:Uncharacterized protein n=1 Tax=Caenorhabditis tropicalis TaxID=1561998 RepID=A0A1I7TPK4_9PELO
MNSLNQNNKIRICHDNPRESTIKGRKFARKFILFYNASSQAEEAKLPSCRNKTPRNNQLPLATRRPSPGKNSAFPEKVSS